MFLVSDCRDNVCSILPVTKMSFSTALWTGLGSTSYKCVCVCVYYYFWKYRLLPTANKLCAYNRQAICASSKTSYMHPANKLCMRQTSFPRTTNELFYLSDTNHILTYVPWPLPTAGGDPDPKKRTSVYMCAHTHTHTHTHTLFVSYLWSKFFLFESDCRFGLPLKSWTFLTPHTLCFVT